MVPLTHDTNYAPVLKAGVNTTLNSAIVGTTVYRTILLSNFEDHEGEAITLTCTVKDAASYTWLTVSKENSGDVTVSATAPKNNALALLYTI